MNVQFGPNSVDEPNLLYKLQRKLKVFITGDPLSNRGYSLVACSSKYGLVFVGSPIATLSVYYLKDLTDKECEPKCMTVKLPEKPTHIATNCDFELLAVTGGALLCIYKVTDFQNQNVSPAVTIKTDVAPSPTAFVSSLQWNPCVPDNISIAFFDGTLLVSQVTAGQVKKVQSKARCICWSPKGKQLVTGNSDGTLCQYKPDLTPAKMVPAPNLFEGAPVEALAIYWISTFQFAVVFKNAADNSRPAMTIVNTPKAGQPTCLNYEDICYSMGTNRPWYYYLIGVAQWNMILSSSSNSMEIATLASTDSSNWMQWCQSDEARPELPLTNKKIENYPVGVCIDTCAIHQLPWGENETLPHMPLLHVVSQSGLLTVFNVINLKKDAPQVCAPPLQIALPAAAMTSEIPNDLPPQAAQAQVPAPPAPMPSKPQEQSQPQATRPFSFAPAAVTTAAAATNAAKPFSYQPPPAQPHAFAAPTPTAQLPQPTEKKQVEAKTVLNIPQPRPQAPQPQQAQTPPAQKPSQEVAAALKAEQERNKLKADQELRNMLVKEVNDFQTELYKFAVKTREVQIKLQKDIESLDPNFNFQSLDAEKLKKECAIDELRSAIVALKLELVRACAFVAEARTQVDAKDLNQWTQVDPLTTKRVSSVKKLAYYVQSQLDQAHKALDYKWNEMTLSDPKLNKPGQRMIRPVLEDVYQPLVRQQEILSRQQAVIRTLKSTLKQCDSSPMFKSTSLLRSTPFRNKDPLSKLTKNILNMSIDPQTKAKGPALSAQKLDALRDMLSNHRPVKIKPASIEIQQHLAGMRLNYEKSVKEKVAQESVVQKKVEQIQVQETVIPQQMKTGQLQSVQIPAQVQIPVPPVQQAAFQVTKPDLISKQVPTTAFTPVNMMKTATVPGLSNVARTLFTDEPPPVQSTPPPQPKLSFAPPTNTTASPNTRSVLKDMLQNKMAIPEPKNDNNTFMGQKICSPINFAASTPLSQAQPPNSFTSKPLSDMNKMFSKCTPQSFAPDPKSSISTANTTKPTKQESSEKQQEKITNLFKMKSTSTLAPTNVPDVLKTNTSSSTKSAEAVKVSEKSKENVEEIPKEVENVKQEKDMKEELNEVTVSATFKLPSKPAAPTVTSTGGDTKKPVQEKSALTITIAKPNASSLFAAASAASPTDEKPSLFGSPGTPTSSPTSLFAQTKLDVAITTPTTAEPTKPAFGSSTNASILFGSAAQSSKTQSGSIFTSTPAFPSNVETKTTSASLSFGSTTTPLGTPQLKPPSTPASPSQLFAAAAAVTTQSAFSSPAASPTPAFGSPSTTISTPTLFGTAATTTPGSLFDTTPTSPTPGLFAAPTTSQSLFGATTTTSQSLFGGATTVTAFGAAISTPSAFGTQTATTQSSLFGSNQTSPASSLFGAAVASQAPAFGATTTTSAFGAPTTPAAFGTQAASAFGATTQSLFTGTPFGSSTPSVFGGGTSQAASVFGGTTQTTQASVFGGAAPAFGATPAPATTASGSLFGNDNNLFAAASISTTSASSPTSGGSIFGGGASSTGSVFAGGNQTNAFGQPNNTAASIFGGGGATTFGQKPATNLWGNANNNNAGAAGFGAPAFGQQPTTQAPSLFGGSGGSFSTPSGGQTFGSPSPGSVFGSAQQQNAPAFGGSSAFGATPAFGQPAGFGSPPSGGGFAGFSSLSKSSGGGFGAPAAFGGTAAFGAPAFGGTSPGKMFGGGGASPGFGAPTQSNSTFETLATQNTLTFGNLAQQSTPPAQQAPTFNASPSFTGWRG